MSNAYHGERGAVTAMRSKPTINATNIESSGLSFSRLPNRKTAHVTMQKPQSEAVATFSTAKQTGGPMPGKDSPPAMPFPSAEEVAQSDLLQDDVFSTWRDDKDSDIPESAEELQKQDPLGTQIWKLYSKTKTRLPNHERMENLTWRMMAMNLKRREREQAL